MNEGAATPHALSTAIKQAAVEFGFDACAITDTDLGEHEARLLDWLAHGFHGEMHFMQQHGEKRSRPARLKPGTIRIISVRLEYRPEASENALALLEDQDRAYISRYALGRDYHKLLRMRLQRLASHIETLYGPYAYRAFCDSAPVMEKAIAMKAGLGWIGKHSNLLNERSGSWFFLGELYTDLPLAIDPPRTQSNCGSCSACLQACPTGAIVEPYVVDSRRCISYLTIEHPGSIPVEFRTAMGNRIYGCDDCQLVCPFNKFSPEGDAAFKPRHSLDDIRLVELAGWSELQFQRRFEGSPIRRIGHTRWLRNIAIALGNAATGEEVVATLLELSRHEHELVREHAVWALQQHPQSSGTAAKSAST